MKRNKIILLNKLLCLLLVGGLFFSCQNEIDLPKSDRLESKLGPNDHYFQMRAYPDQDYNLKAYKSAMSELKNSVSNRSTIQGFDKDWVTQGPGNIGGRINSVAVHPTDSDIIYAGFSHGGVFKTIDGGDNWEPIFDDQAFLSIGVIEIDPNDTETIFVGTGDVNIPGGFFIGNGIYKSTNGGETWSNIGLTEHGIISKIEVHPTNSQIVYAGAMGIPSIRDENRGLYKSTDGGLNWQPVLQVADQAGVIDLLLHPQNPDIVFASTWDRHRTNFISIVSGSNAGVWKTSDGGQNWDNVIEPYLDGGEMGRIGLAMSGTDPDIVTALLIGPSNNDLHSIIQTNDSGETWDILIDEQRFDDEFSGSPLGGFGWYFGKIRMNPRDDNDLFLLGVDLWRSRDKGETWALASPRWWEYIVHADKHDLDFTADGGFTLATDGGLYKTDIETTEWIDIENLPTTQFYRVAYNPHQPDSYFGGAQDNGTTGGNRDSINAWPRLWGGDGFQPVYHPTDPNIFYYETQFGNINGTEDGGENFFSADEGLAGESKNWDMPYMLSPHDPDVMYVGTDKLFRSFIGPEPFFLPMTDSLTDETNSSRHTVSTLDESPLVVGQVYVGTTDGNVWRTQFVDFFHEVVDISTGLPDRYVTSIKASPTLENTVFVTHSGYLNNEYLPRIHRSDDGGSNWIDISGNLPDIAINDVLILPERGDSILFVGTDGGVYGSINGGEEWERLGANMPIIPVQDMDYNVINRELVAATYARSIQSYDLSEILDEVSDVEESSTPLALKTSLKISPNPAADFVNLEFFNSEKGKTAQLVILDIQGRVVFQKQIEGFGNNETQVDISKFASGQYVAKLKIRHRVEAVSFIKE